MRILSDTEINCRVRQALVQRWLDLGRLSLRTTRGVVHLHGTLAKISDAETQVSQEEISGLLLAIGAIPGVERVQVDLSNLRELAAGS